MSERARELLKNHNYLLSRESVLVAHLASLEKMLGGEPDDIIAALALGRRMDGTPPSGRSGSQTEYIALNHDLAAKVEAADIQAAAAEAARELWQVRIELSLYEAVLKSLNETEKRFVQLYYDESISMNKIADMNLLPNAHILYSARTLGRLNNTILKKVDDALGLNLTGVRIS